MRCTPSFSSAATKSSAPFIERAPLVRNLTAQARAFLAHQQMRSQSNRSAL
jgi:hypothetical protein